MFQDNSTICLPHGSECYQTLPVKDTDCLIPCTGVYAFVTKKTDDAMIDISEKFKVAVKEYENYTTGYQTKVKYPKQFQGMFYTLKIFSQNLLSLRL